MKTPQIERNAKLTIKMPDSNNGVNAGATALFDLPATFRYHAAILVCSALTIAQIEEVRVLLNGKVIQRYKGAQRDTINQYLGLGAYATDSILTLSFDRVGLLSRATRESTAINCGVPDKNGVAITQFQIEIDVAAGAVSPAISLYADVSAPVAGGAGDVMRILPLPRSAQGAGKKDISDLGGLGSTEGLLLSAAYIESPSINSLEVKRDQDTLFERTTALNSKAQNDAGLRTPQAGWFMLDTSEQGYGQNLIQVAGSKDFRFIFDMSAADDFDIVVEQMGVLGR